MAERVYGSIEVNAPVEQVYLYWQNLENLPQFMSDIEEVRSTGPDTTHWRVKGPLGTKMEFDARTTEDHPNRAIGWNAEGDDAGVSGEVRLEELGPDRTRVFVSFDLSNPPGGKLGEAASKVVANPKAMMQRDLQNFKEIIEGTATPEDVRPRVVPGEERGTAGEIPDPAELEEALERLEAAVARAVERSGASEEDLAEDFDLTNRGRPEAGARSRKG